MSVSAMWKPVRGYEGLYEVSDTGIVRSNRKELKPQENNHGYLRVVLSKDGVEKRHYIHRMVAEAFLPNPGRLRCVNHKDENPKNNNMANLEWCDHKYNMNYGTAKARMSESKSIPVVATIVSSGIKERYKSIAEATTIICGRHHAASNISAVLKGKRKTAFGRRWEIAKEDK